MGILDRPQPTDPTGTMGRLLPWSGAGPLPASRQVPPTGSGATASLLRAAGEDDEARTRRIARAWRYYYGRQRRSLRVPPGAPDDNVMLNLCRLAVNKAAAYLFGSEARSIRWSVVTSGPDTPGPDEEAGAWLEHVWGKRRVARLKASAINGGVAGQVFWRIVPAGSRGGRTWPRLVLLDPATVTPLWEPDDYEAVYEYRIEFTGIDQRTAKAITRRQRIALAEDGRTWEIVDEQRIDGGAFVPIDRETWPYPFPPIVEHQHLPAPNVHWGVPELDDDILHLQDAINAAASNLQRIGRLFGHPRQWAKGLDPDQPIDLSPQSVLILPGSEAQVGQLELGADVPGLMQFYNELRATYHELSRMPEVAAGRVLNLGPVSGVALRVLYEPLVEATEDRQGTYGEGLEDLMWRLLVVGGFVSPEDVETEVTITWPEVAPTDPLADRQAAVLDQQLGVSRTTILENLGYDPEAEARNVAAEGEQMGSAMLGAFDQGQQAAATPEPSAAVAAAAARPAPTPPGGGQPEEA